MIDLHGISQESFDLIVASEVTSREVYEHRYRQPTYPGVESGVTGGIGYDFGQNTARQTAADWSGKVPDSMVKRLARCAGVIGPAARQLAIDLRADVDIPWDAALEVFSNHDVPRYLGKCYAHCPNFETLSPHCKGAILSIVFNRGPSFDQTGPRYAEMRGIKAAIKSGNLAGVPALIRSMKRLWPGVHGLQTRRENEAALFERGLREHHNIEPDPTPVPDPEVVAHVQEQLRNLGYFHVGAPDGSKGSATEAAILAFRHDNGLPLTPAIDDELLNALLKAQPKEIPETRANATVHDLREQKSATISFTDKIKAWAGKLFGGGISIGGAGGVLGLVTDQATQVTNAKQAVGALGISPTAWMIIAGAAGVTLLVGTVAIGFWYVADKIERQRLYDYRTGKHL